MDGDGDGHAGAWLEDEQLRAVWRSFTHWLAAIAVRVGDESRRTIRALRGE